MFSFVILLVTSYYVAPNDWVIVNNEGERI
jgi:hypothetical protein